LPIDNVTEQVKIHLRAVSRQYLAGGESFYALEGINLEVSAGEFLCIVGPSGCGKSTLLHLIAGMDRPSGGSISLDGEPVVGPGPDRLLILQELGLFPWLTARENVEFGLKLKSYSKSDRRELARRYLNLVHLSQFENSYPHQLSGGMKQRVALARALVMKPDVLLMDEPFAALDAQTRDRLHDELERIWDETGQTIIFVTHNVREAVRLGDRVVVMGYRPGRIKREFRIALERPRHLENVEVARAARQIHNCLREEIEKSTRAEYQDELGD
jgi:NitT/TauT family transport system ATP-binding protein